MPILGDDATTTNLARAMQAMLREIGVDMTITVRASADFSKVYIGRSSTCSR